MASAIRATSMLGLRADDKDFGLGAVLVVIPTYNEADNIARIIQAVLPQSPAIEILIVDDSSPDGTGDIAEVISVQNKRVHVLHRRGPRGLGTAYMAGFRWALRRKYQLIVQMDADFSHDPHEIPKLLNESKNCDLVVGSRYCPGGRTLGWPRRRQWLSFAANVYARTLVGSRIRDLTGGFKCWRRELLERIDFASLRCEGYAFQFDMGHLAELAGAKINEVPITFFERKDGTSKMTPRVAQKAARHALRLAWDRMTGRRHCGLLPSKSALPQPRCIGQVPRNVLVMCLGGIGDSILSFAMFRELRERLPDSRLTALVMWPQAAQLIEDLGVFDEILQHNFQTDQGWRSAAKLLKLRFRRYDTSILAYPTNRWEFKLASWIIHAKHRIGHKYENSGWFDNACYLLTDVVNQSVPGHNVDENLKLLQALPGCQHAPDRSADIRAGYLDPCYHTWANKQLAAIPGPYLGITAGCAEYKNMCGKRWPVKDFAELCRSAYDQLGLMPLLFGAPAERDLNRLVVASAGVGYVIDDPSLRHAAAAMCRCSVFVANDSALAHLASALDVPTVMIVGPTDPEMVAPYAGRGVALSARIPCSPCYRHSRKPLVCSAATSFKCIQSVSVESVVRQLCNLLTVREEVDARTDPKAWLKTVAPSDSDRGVCNVS